MVSIGPYSQSNNFTHMFDFTDLQTNQTKKQSIGYCPNSLMSIIHKNPDFSKFKYLVKLANLENILDSSQANFTLFIPSDNQIKHIPDEIFINMDSSTARHIVKSSMLEKKIPSELLEASPASYFITKDPPNKLFVGNISGQTYICDNINVIQKDIITDNGIIHVIDKLIQPYII